MLPSTPLALFALLVLAVASGLMILLTRRWFDRYELVRHRWFAGDYNWMMVLNWASIWTLVAAVVMSVFGIFYDLGEFFLTLMLAFIGIVWLAGYVKFYRTRCPRCGRFQMIERVTGYVCPYCNYHPRRA
jgi:hypothetical protein